MAVAAIVGRPNVGKSTLFNRLCRKRQALVDDLPGVTRDRHYGEVSWEGRTFTLVDTGGFISGDVSILEEETRTQILAAVEQADLVLFVLDAKTGLHPEDEEIARLLRHASRPVLHAINKIDGREQKTLAAEFYRLGVERFHTVSAAHGLGVGDLLSDMVRRLPETPSEPLREEGEIRMAVLGRPNVGKSTLVNRLLEEPRVIVSPIPGTTRDAIDSPFDRDGQRYVLIDTAGIRRKGRTKEKLEKISILKALQSIDRCHVAILLVDSSEGVTDQDLHIGGYVQQRYRACLVGLNKWDLTDLDPKRAKNYLKEVRDRFRFLPHAPLLTLSAATGKRVSRILPAVLQIHEQYNRRASTSAVNRALEEAVARHEPPYVGRRRLKFYYGTQASVRPPTFVLFCSRPESVHFSYQRYLTNAFREAFGLDKTPVRLFFRGKDRGA